MIFQSNSTCIILHFFLMSSVTLSFCYFFLSNTNVATVAQGISSWPFFFPTDCIVNSTDVQVCAVILAKGWESGVERGGWREGIVREFGMDMYTMYWQWITHKDRLYTQETLLSVLAAWMGEEIGGEWIHVHVRLSPFAAHLKLSQQF